jgi:hypothetical protein
MRFVDSYLLYFRQQLITCPLLDLLPFQSLFTERSHGDHLLALPPFSYVLRAPYPLCCVFLFRSLFIILFFLFWGRVQSVQGAMLVYPKGSCGNMMCRLFSHLLFCVSQAGLVQASEVQEPSCFLIIMCCKEASYRLGVQGVRIWILLGQIPLNNSKLT